MILFLFSLWQLGLEPLDMRVINQDNKSYVCIDPQDAQRLLQLRLDYPILKQTIQKYESLILVHEAEAGRLNGSVADLSVQLLEQGRANEELKKILNAPIPWYKHWYVWTVVGIAVGVATTIIVYEAIGHPQVVVSF